MKRRPFLFVLSFCIPVFFGLAAGAGRPIVRVAPSLAVTPPAPGPMVPRQGPARFRERPLRFCLTPGFQDDQGFPVRIACIEITVVEDPKSGIPVEVTRVPVVRDPLWTVPFTIKTTGNAMLRAIAEDGRISDPKTYNWQAAAVGCLIDPYKTHRLRHTFIFRTK